jgi:hypothetical protein
MTFDRASSVAFDARMGRCFSILYRSLTLNLIGYYDNGIVASPSRLLVNGSLAVFVLSAAMPSVTLAALRR